MQDERNESIEKTRAGFEESFAAEAFYNKQTQDQAQLERILHSLSISGGMKILDLGTGTGYLSFPLARRYPTAAVAGLDIVEKTLERSREKAAALGLDNLRFVCYDGGMFPFADGTFDRVVTRYALHHFPAVRETFREISRVLKPGGVFFLSDPAPNEDDADRFVDAYMRMKKDGHIKFYTRDEWRTMGTAAGLVLTDGFETQIRFPRKRRAALEWPELTSRFKQAVIAGYAVEILEDEIWITERVNNLLFKKTSV